MAIYRNYSRDQIEIKTMCINDYIEKDHLAKIIVKIVSKMDLKSFDEVFNNDMGGKPAYPVNNLLALLIFAYLDGVYSSRKIETYCREHLAYKYLCCDDPPDHVTITRFYKRFHEQIRHVFVQTIYIGIKEGLITFETLAVDGVKISAMSSKSEVISIDNSDTLLNSIENQIDNLISQINKSNDINIKEELIKKIKKKN
jgi:transposase